MSPPKIHSPSLSTFNSSVSHSLQLSSTASGSVLQLFPTSRDPSATRGQCAPGRQELETPLALVSGILLMKFPSQITPGPGRGCSSCGLGLQAQDGGERLLFGDGA